MSVRFFYNFTLTKNNPEFFFLSYIVLSAVLFLIFFHYNLIKKITENTNIFFIILVIFTAYIFYKYPNSIGTERDDCYRIIINNIYNLNFPYSKTELGDPCSTGLSGLILYFPVLFFKNYFALTTTVSFLMFYFLLKKYFNKSTLIFLLYIQLFNLLHLEESIAGSDFFLISISYLVGIIYLNDYFENKKLTSFFIAFLMLYFFYGSRIVFIFLLPVNYIIFICIYNFKNVNKFFIYQFIFTVLTILIPLLINPIKYHPAHIILKGYNIIGFNILIYFTLFFSFLLLINIYFLMNSKKYKNFLSNFINKYNIFLHLSFFVLPLLIIIIKSLIDRINTDLIENWEGLSYMILIYPSFIFIFSSFFKSKKIWNNDFLSKINFK
ncbi:hypothetical protein OAD70_07385 [Candidatus Pelagibacter sp.]|nr:hypothetical protein [Candidatus Pelagibacter sp.]|tara:strand:- start:442 stop:1584 length:1143 start_codon:yes stop_codon:yes gene_type:complete